MRSLADRKYEDERADADDRDLRSRTDAKFERVREETALRELAEQLVGLKSRQLQRLELPDALLEAVLFAQSIASAPAFTRQIRLIRQHLRQLGRHSIEARLAEPQSTKSQGTAAPPAQGESERWLERLLAEGDAALEELLREHPQADRQALRQQLRACAKARQGAGGFEGRPVRAEARLKAALEQLLG